MDIGTWRSGTTGSRAVVIKGLSYVDIHLCSLLTGNFCQSFSPALGLCFPNLLSGDALYLMRIKMR